VKRVWSANIPSASSAVKLPPTSTRGADDPVSVERVSDPSVAEKPEQAIRWKPQSRARDEAEHRARVPRSGAVHCWAKCLRVPTPQVRMSI